MPVVIISAATFSHGDEVAARAAELLRYRLVGRDEIVESAARAYGSTPDRLIEALDEPASWLSMPAKERRARLVAFQAALSDVLLEGDCVCHGLAAHLYVSGISHVFKSRVTAPIEARIAAAAERENLTPAKARKLVLGHDKRRRRWVTSLYDVDENDAANFDLVIDHEATGTEGAAVLIADTARSRRFEPMTFSLAQMRDFALASKVRALLFETDPEVVVRADDGAIHIRTKALRKKGGKAAAFEERARSVPQVRTVEIEIIDDVFARAADSMR